MYQIHIPSVCLLVLLFVKFSTFGGKSFASLKFVDCLCILMGDLQALKRLALAGDFTVLM